MLDRRAVEQVRAQQQELVDWRIWSIGNAELFGLNSTFHGVIIGCSGKYLIVDALQRVDRLRRLIEYRKG